MATKIGFIGLGIMGRGMAARLVTQLDTHLVVWNRTKAIGNTFASQHSGKVTVVDNPSDVVKACDVTYCMLSTLEASLAVFNEPNGVLSGISPGKTIIDCATLTPERMQEEDAQIREKGGIFLEAPVSGSKGPAETGTLIFLCGGNKEVYDKSIPELDAMGKANFFFGASGEGTKVKLIVNMTMATQMAAFSEGLAMCEAAGLPADDYLKVLDLGAIACPMYKLKGPNMLKRQYAPHFPLKHAQKDMRFALALAEDLGVNAPTTAASNQEFIRSIVNGHGDDDFSAVYEGVNTSCKRTKSS